MKPLAFRHSLWAWCQYLDAYLATISSPLFSSDISHHEHTRAGEHLRLSITAITGRWLFLGHKAFAVFLASDDDGILKLRLALGTVFAPGSGGSADGMQ
jgi:hypothetical protein